jgi:thiol-disulfide isomerase/thioredoxin
MITRRTGLATLAALAAPGIVAAQPDPGSAALPPPLEALGGLALHTPERAPTRLNDHLRPGPSVIAFWATWCSPCLTEGRELARIRTRVTPDQLNIVGVNMDRDEVRSSDRLAQFMQRARMNYTQLWGNVALFRAFNNPGEGNRIVLPRLYVFAADGAPRAALGRYDGAASLREISRAIEGVLS